jgi:2,4-dienoyl-CoA reductase-like NADH-dependent reductase (Old Yellow Enzyme family)
VGRDASNGMMLASDARTAPFAHAEPLRTGTTRLRNLGRPQDADAAIRDEWIDLALLGTPALTNPHWPVWAARELGLERPFALLPDDWQWWIEHFRGPEESIGLPPAAAPGR